MNKPISPEVRSEIVKLSLSGVKTQLQIASIVKVAPSTVHKVLKERQRILDGIKDGKVISANVPKTVDKSKVIERTLKAKAEKAVETEVTKINTIKRVKLVADNIEVPTPSSMIKITCNDLNIHVNTRFVTDIFISERGVKLVTK